MALWFVPVCFHWMSSSIFVCNQGLYNRPIWGWILKRIGLEVYGLCGCKFRVLDFGMWWRWIVTFTLQPLYTWGKILWYLWDRDWPFVFHVFTCNSLNGISNILFSTLILSKFSHSIRIINIECLRHVTTWHCSDWVSGNTVDLYSEDSWLRSGPFKMRYFIMIPGFKNTLD